MFAPITASADITIAQTFGPVTPEAFVEATPRIVSEKTNSLSGFLPIADRVNLSPLAQAKSRAAPPEPIETSANSTNSTDEEADAEPSNEFVQVTSSIGRAASSGNLRRDEAMALYQKISALV